MATTVDKALVRRLVEELWNHANVSIVDELYDPRATQTIGDDQQQSVEEIKQAARALHSAFPDLHMSIDHLLAEGNEVVATWTLCGTHRGPLAAITPPEATTPVDENHFRAISVLAPTGRRVTLEGVTFYRIRNSKIVSSRVLLNGLGAIRQLGAIPLMAATGHSLPQGAYGGHKTATPEVSVRGVRG
jgi:predicted ester cyclase